MKEQMIEIANTQVNGKYIFNGTDTNIKPVIIDENRLVDSNGDEIYNDNNELVDSDSGRNRPVNIEVSKGINFEVNVDPEIFNQDLFDSIQGFIDALDPEEGEDQQGLLNDSIGDLQKSSLQIINGRAELGAKMNRLDLIEDRLEQQNIIAEDTMAKNEGVDFEEAVMNLLTQEVIHRAALAAGSKIIQPSLVDFLR